ncbi:hypothetical protein PVAG01_00730 [Phlyctema vagabunda]|uniref:Uncharacterized protein n=1 Tax=Phlyctema vagabunda TaxID=108571 RepID=A0ABR4PWG8_9HELO
MSIPGIPGLGQAPPVATLSSAPITAATTAVHELLPNSEWRFEVAIGQSIELKARPGPLLCIELRELITGLPGPLGHG